MAAFLLVRPTTVSRAGTQDGEPSMLQVVGVSQPVRQSSEEPALNSASPERGSRLLCALRTLVGCAMRRCGAGGA